MATETLVGRQGENMDLQYTGKLMKAEYLMLVKLNNQRFLKKKGFVIDFWVLLIGTGVLFLLFSVVTTRQWDTSRSGLFPWYVIEFLVGFLLMGFGLKVRALPSKFWDENQDTLSKIEGKISDEAIEVFTPNGNLRINWSELNGYSEHQGAILLYKPPSTSLPFLGRFFERQEDWLSFKQMVADRLPLTHRVNQFAPPKSGTRPVYILFIVSIIIMIIYYFLHGG